MIYERNAAQMAFHYSRARPTAASPPPKMVEKTAKVPKPVDPMRLTTMLETPEHKGNRPMSAVTEVPVEDVEEAMRHVNALKAAAASAKMSMTTQKKYAVAGGMVCRDVSELDEEDQRVVSVLKRHKVPVIVAVEGECDLSDVKVVEEDKMEVAESASVTDANEEEEEEEKEESSSDVVIVKQRKRNAGGCAFIDDEAEAESGEVEDDEEASMDKYDSEDSFINDDLDVENESVEWSADDADGDDDLIIMEPPKNTSHVRVKIEGERRKRKKHEPITVKMESPPKRQALDSDMLMHQRQLFDAFIQGKDTLKYLTDTCPKPFVVMLRMMFETWMSDEEAKVFPFLAKSTPNNEPGFYYYLIDSTRRQLFDILKKCGWGCVESVFQSPGEVSISVSCAASGWQVRLRSTTKTQTVSGTREDQLELLQVYTKLSNFRRQLRARVLALVAEWRDTPGSLSQVSDSAVFRNPAFWKPMWAEYKAVVDGS